MPTPPPKPQLWLLEEATPEVAQLMHQIERSLNGLASVQRVSYAEALRRLPREDERARLAAVIAFSLPMLRNLAALLKGVRGARPRACLVAPDTPALATLKASQRWPMPVAAAARHAGEAELLGASGWRAEAIARLGAEVHAAALPDGPREPNAPLHVGLDWHNLSRAQRDAIRQEAGRWQQSAPDRLVWHIFHLPGDAPDGWDAAGVHCHPVTREALAGGLRPPLDVLLADPWWPEALPRPHRAAVRLFLPPGAQVDGWQERLQSLVDLASSGPWDESGLLAFRFAPLWRMLLHGEEPQASPLVPADPTELAAARDHWHGQLKAERAAWAERGEGPSTTELRYHHWLYDYRVQCSWAHDLWAALAEAKNGERHRLLAAFNAMGLHQASAGWLFKRHLALTSVARTHGRRVPFGPRFYARFAFARRAVVWRWARALWRCGEASAANPLATSREVSRALLDWARVTVVRRNEPAPVSGVPTLYLLSHRHAELDPFLLLDALPGPLAVVVGPRAQRWPFVERLGHSSAFVLAGHERGVVIADAIAAVRSRRALALYPEVAEPSYLGETSPPRQGLLWIVQALERSQVIPVAVDDAYALGPDGGTVSLWFGEPIACSAETGDELLHAVRAFFHRHLPRAIALDCPGWLERRVEPALAPEIAALDSIAP